MSLSAVHLSAQGLFERPGQEIRYERYMAVWECLAGVQRVRDSMRTADPVWRDTLPWDAVEARRPFPSEVVHVAERCNHAIVTHDERSVYARITLMLLANDIAGAERAISTDIGQKRYATVSQAMDAMVQVLEIYAEIPERPLFSMNVLSAIMEQQTMSPARQTMLWGKYLEAARARNDRQLVEMVGGRIADLANRLDTDDYDGSEMRQSLKDGIREKNRKELLDSLRLGGGASYARYFRKVYETALQSARLSILELDGVGEQAIPIQARYWYPDTLAQQIPAAGKTSLLIFLDLTSYLNPTGGWTEHHDFFATLRRIKRQFPDLDVTIVSRTLGWFGHGPTLSVQEEGLVLRKWLLDTRQLPARLAIDSTPFYHLPGNDGRRINVESDNDVNYGLGAEGLRTNRLHNKERVVLISADGVILRVGPLNRKMEREYTELLEVLFPKAAASR